MKIRILVVALIVSWFTLSGMTYAQEGNSVKLEPFSAINAGTSFLEQEGGAVAPFIYALF